MNIIDLSLKIENGLQTSPSQIQTVIIDYVTREFTAPLYESPCEGFTAKLLVMTDHLGTHVDAPVHFIKGGKDISEMPLDKFIGRAYCLDFTDKSPSKLIDREMLEKKLKNNNINPKEGDIILIRAWPGKWGEKGFFSCQGLDLEAAKFLLNKKIKMIGIDLRMFDIVGDKHRPLHMLFLKNEIPLIENLVNLDKLPTHKHFLFIGLPLNLGLCTASPIRAVAILDGEIAMLDSKN